MKRYTLLLHFVLFFLANVVFAQTSSLGGTAYSSPAAAAIPAAIKSPVSIASGIPDLNFSLFSLPTHSKDISVDTGINYHPNNTFQYSAATDVGLGWNLTGVHGAVYFEMGTGNYYFTFLGRNGRFKVEKDANNNWIINKISLNKLQISLFTNSANEVVKYLIVDELGYKYIFDQLDLIRMPGGPRTGGYYLSSVTDAKDMELLRYEYIVDEYDTAPPGSPLPAMEKKLKLSTIISPDFGSISLNYHLNTALRKSYNDPFNLVSIILKNNAGNEIQKFGFEYMYLGYDYPMQYFEGIPYTCQTVGISKRRLIKLLKYSRSGTFETTEFGYGNYFLDNAWTESIPQLGCFTNEDQNPKHYASGILVSAKLPTGSELKYDYEPNQYYVNKNTQDYLTNGAPPNDLNDRDAQYYEVLLTMPFDTNSLNAFHLNANPDTPDGSSYLAYFYNVTEYYNSNGTGGGPPFTILDPTDTSNNTNKFVKLKINGLQTYSDNRVKCSPGMKHIEITGTGGKGTLTIVRIRYKTIPLRNFSTGKGVRIKTIDYFDAGSLVPALSRKYFYQQFEDSTKTSGLLNDFDDLNSVVYDNVKEVIGSGAGFTQYYFKTLYDFSENLRSDGYLTGGGMKHSNILSTGLLYKKEIFDNSNAKVASEENVYEFHELPSFLDNKPSIIKKHIITSKQFHDTGTLTQIEESQRSTLDYNVVYKKSTGSDGNVTEEFTTYPLLVTQNPRLANAGIRDIPLAAEIKKNGSTVHKAETKYEDSSHLYPTAQVSFLPDNPLQSITNVSYDIYDDKGNLVQYTGFPETGTGKPTTVIWGYNKTMPIAKVEGAKLSDIPSQLIGAIVAASNSDADATIAQQASTEAALVNALNTFRTDASLKDFMISCYTYDPLIGATKMIPLTGMMELYEYDSYNRLQKIKDVNGVTLKEYQYNYKH